MEAKWSAVGARGLFAAKSRKASSGALFRTLSKPCGGVKVTAVVSGGALHRGARSILAVVTSHGSHEVEIKFRVADLPALEARLRTLQFRNVTPRTFEVNTLYDFAAGTLRQRGELLRIRRYGQQWTVTHKSGGSAERYKTRVETETGVTDGEALARIFGSLGLEPTFVYEKYRSEWSDSQGYVVLDETPIGDFAEIEGPPQWIDRTAEALQVADSQYITVSYAALFDRWKHDTGLGVRDMTFAEVQPSGSS